MLKHHELQTMLASIHSHDFSMPSEVHRQLLISKNFFLFFFLDGYTPQVKNSQYLTYSGIAMVAVLTFADFFIFFVYQESKILQFAHNHLIKYITIECILFLVIKGS